MKEYLKLAHTIRELVADDQLTQAIAKLKDASANLDHLDHVIMQQARYVSLRNSIMTETLDPERVGVEYNRIRKNLFELIRELEHEGKAQMQVFISYSQSGPGGELAKSLHDYIENEGFVAFLDTQDIRVGEDWAASILGAIKASDYFVLLLSPEANCSDMVMKEVIEARRLQLQFGKPVILPVRVQWPENLQLNHNLSGWLHRIQHLFWEGAQDSTKVIQKLHSVISQRETLRLTHPVDKKEIEAFVEQLDMPPIPAAPLEIPRGSVVLGSPYYIERKGEEGFIERVVSDRAVLRIKGPRQYGKTSLLSRIINKAKEAEFRVVSFDFQNLSENTLGSFNILIWEFCSKIAYDLDIEDTFEDFWETKLKKNPKRDIKQLAKSFVERKILKELGLHILLAIDEADRLFPYHGVSNDFFSMLRGWFEAATNRPVWNNVRMAISYSTEINLHIKVINNSPFNIGEDYDLSPFTHSQISKLCNLHQLVLTKDQIGHLSNFLGGQPYLIRRALYCLANKDYSFQELIDVAPQEKGPFGDHLRRHLFNIGKYPELLQCLKLIIQSGHCNDPILADRLSAAGLTVGSPPDKVRFACDLYKIYFKLKV